MAFDTHSPEAYSTVLTAPSPATSGTSLVLQSSDGAKFGYPQNATVWPAGTSIPTKANSEIVRITGISTDTLTIVRAQEGSSAISITVGMQIANTITPKVLTDIEAQALGGTLTATSTNTLSNKSIAAGSNTISGLTNSNLSGSAGITYANIASTNTATAYNPYKFSVYRNASLSLASGGFTVVIFDAENFDTGSNYSVSTGKFTAPVSGYYQFNACINFVSMTNGQTYVISLLKNGSEYWRGGQITPANSGDPDSLLVSALIELSATDYIEVAGYNNQGSSIALSVGTGPTQTWFSGFLVSAT